VVLYIKPTFANPPRWQALLAEAFDLAQIDLRVKSSSAVLFISMDGRKFALTFGHGHTMLDESMLVHDFGLKASLGTVSPEQLRNIDVMRPESTALRKRHQTGRSSRIDEFEIDHLLDVVRSITGRSGDQEFAKKVTGTSALKITADLDFSTIAAKCSRALGLYETNAYQENFALIDNLRPERDPLLLSQLDQDILRALSDQELDHIYLSPPDIIDQQEIVGFKFRGYAGDPIVPDLDIADYLATRPGDEALDIETIKRRHKVFVQYEADDAARPQWPIYKCLIYETELQGHRYVLADGHWYRIDAGFRERVNQFFEERTVRFDLPAAGNEEFERDYCVRLAQQNGFALFDRQTFSFPGDPTGYELCDVLTRDRILLHTKPYRNGSGTLSHLFRQGEMAGELLCREPEFRRQARQHLLGQRPDWADVIPEGQVDARLTKSASV
jgi:uncharacterized protein (TIGR04141 family)